MLCNIRTVIYNWKRDTKKWNQFDLIQRKHVLLVFEYVRTKMASPTSNSILNLVVEGFE